MSEDVVALLRAVNFAARKHTNQRRKGEATEPYVNHVIEVAGMLAEATAARDPILLIAGVLHDTIEDTGTSREEITAEFCLLAQSEFAARQRRTHTCHRENTALSLIVATRL